jgi:hypothetical protein
MSGPAAGRTHLVLVGATGMVGGYALRYALEHPAVERVSLHGAPPRDARFPSERGSGFAGHASAVRRCGNGSPVDPRAAALRQAEERRDQEADGSARGSDGER